MIDALEIDDNYMFLSDDVSGDNVFFVRVPAKVPSTVTETVSEVPNPVYLDSDTYISVSLVCTVVICLFLLITRR